MENIKNSKGEVLSQPYLDLARMRREQYKVFSNEKLMASAFAWADTLEGGEFWAKVSDGLTPEIPAASLAELDEWRKAKDNSAEPATEWKAMYYELKTATDALLSEYKELKELYDNLDVTYQRLYVEHMKAQTPTRNWVAECAMAILSNTPAGYSSWDLAEAWASDGVKRGHLPKIENA